MAAGTRRYRAGTTAPSNTLTAVFMLVGAAAFVAIGVGRHEVAFDVMGPVLALGALWFLLDSVNGLRPVRVTTELPLTLSIPTFSLRHGYGRTVWSLGDVYRAELTLSGGGLGFAYRSAYFVGRRDGLSCDSLTCTRGRRHPERTRAGRAVAEILAMAEDTRPW